MSRGTDLGKGSPPQKKKNSAFLVPRNIVASNLKWNMFGTTKTLTRAGHLAKMNLKEVTKNRMVILPELQSSSAEKGEPSRKTTISFRQSGLYGTVAIQKPLLSKRHMTTRL